VYETGTKKPIKVNEINNDQNPNDFGKIKVITINQIIGGTKLTTLTKRIMNKSIFPPA
jgi:hypothetical protein